MSFQLFNNKTWTFPLKCQNAAGVAQPFPTNPSAESSNPASLSAAILGPSPGFFLMLTPKVQVSPGLTVTVSATGMAPVVFAVDVAADPDMLSVAVDTANATTAVQNVPTAPGP